MKSGTTLASIIGLVALIVMTGCRNRSDIRTEIIGYSVEKRPIECTIIGDGKDTCMVLATIHGDEYAGTPLGRELIRFLSRRPDLTRDRKIVIVPVVNPDGYHHIRRTNVNGVDLNRNFPAGNRTDSARHGTGLSEPESRVLHDLVMREKPSRIISFHQPLRCIDWDGPGEALAREMGKYTVLPVKRLGSRPGSLGSFAGEDLGIPIITYELPRNASSLSLDQSWSRYGNALLAGVLFPQPLPEHQAGQAWTSILAFSLTLFLVLLGTITTLVKRQNNRGVT